MKLLSLAEIGDSGGTVQLFEGTFRYRLVAFEHFLFADLPPGTIGHHHEHSDTGVVLVPTPSEDPNDPLRWSRLKKLTAFVIVNSFAFMVSFMIGGLSQGFFILSKEFDEPIPKIAGLLTYCILTLGLGVSLHAYAVMYRRY